jgi:hypothetical protein
VSAKHEERGSFAEVLERFFDLTESAGFFEACQRTAPHDLESCVREVVRTMAPGTTVRLIETASFGSTGFAHGRILTSDAVGCFFWFRDEGHGLVHLHHASGLSSETRFRTTVGARTRCPEAPSLAYAMRVPAGVH